MYLLTRALLHAEVEILRILKESGRESATVNYALRGTHSGHEKNSGINSRTSPRMSCDADE